MGDPAAHVLVVEDSGVKVRPLVALEVLRLATEAHAPAVPVVLPPVAVVAVEGAVAEADSAALRLARKRKRYEQHLNYPMPRRKKSRRNCETFARPTARSNRNWNARATICARY